VLKVAKMSKSPIRGSRGKFRVEVKSVRCKSALETQPAYSDGLRRAQMVRDSAELQRARA
jgi:hypothetical protein